MKPEVWARVQEIFDEAVELEAEAQADFVREASGGDAELQAEVLALLEADAGEQPLLDGGALSALGALADTPEVVGAYKVIEPIGAGGMGDVFLAERADGHFEQRVALKLIRPGVDSGPMQARFRNERQILSGLAHPNIARLLDGGVTGAGRLYFTMEHVAGEPLVPYADARKMPIEGRLRLFVQVCRGVHYAHQNLVVHRDLKPDNILVTEDGVPKLLDFGIAKVVGEGADDDLSLTGTHQRIMTPAYAAPEQILGQPITTQTDVHALGVILFELLTGVSPWGHRTSMAELERAVCETQAPPPSSVHQTIDASARGDVDRGRLRRLLSGDLDTICLKALRKEPERRYASVRELSDDLERYLDGRPVSARRDSVSYRASKFVARNKAPVVAATAVVALLAALVTVYTYQLAVERDRAQREAEKAKQVSGFLVDVFTAPDPGEARGETITARTLLDRGARRVEGELDDQPLVKAELMVVMGDVYLALGLYTEASKLVEEALALRRAAPDAAPADLADTLHTLGEIRREQNALEEASRLLEEALALRRGLEGDQRAPVARILITMGGIEGDEGDYEASKARFDEALALYEALGMGEEPEAAGVMSELALVEDKLANFEGAKALCRRGIALYVDHYGQNHPSTASVINNLAYVHKHAGEYEASEARYREALAIRRKVLGGQHADTAHTLNHLASLLRDLGRYGEAIPYYREALAIRRGLYGSSNPAVGASLAGLAGTLNAVESFEEAAALYREAAKVLVATVGERHPYVAAVKLSLGRCLVELGALEEAEALIRESHALHIEVLPEDSPRSAHASRALAELLMVKGALEEAEPHLREALRVYEAKLPPGHVDIAGGKASLGYWLHLRGRTLEGRPLLEQAVEVLDEKLAVDHPRTRRARERLAVLNGAPPKVKASVPSIQKN